MVYMEVFMEKELQKKKPEDKKDNSLSVILFSSLAAILFLIADLYLMICMPELLPAIAVAGLAVLGCTYVSVSTLVKRTGRKEAEQAEQYASILKSEKASYLLIRKYFDEISEQLSLMEDKFSDPFQEVIAAQKATAKVTISRNRENTDALMNSNDKLLDLIFQMESKLDEISGVVSSDAAEQVGNKNAELLQRQIETTNQLAGQIREMELSLKNEILQAVNKMAMVSPQVVMTAPQPQQMPVQPQMSMTQEPDPLPDLPDMDLSQEPEPLADIMEEPEPLPDIMEEPEPLPDIMEEPEPLPDIMEEPEPLPDLMEEPVAPMPEPDPVIEEIPPMPDLSDPNKTMSPDDIAALLASINGGADAEPEVVADEIAEDLPEEPADAPEEVLDTQIVSGPEEEAAEDVPPMPDLSDPNKVMSPDEIAALFANLG